MISGFLTKESPLRKVFPSGVVPLTIPGSRFCKVAGELATVECYFLNVRSCTPEQRRGLAELMASLGQGTIEEAEEHLASVDEIPVRTVNISGVGMPLRAFI